MIRGIPGSPTALHGVPYQLTEEFVAVYRMHPLIPDEFSFRSLADDHTLQERTLPELGVLHVRERLTEMSMADVFYSFGTSHPGAITLHNFPRFLQHFDKADGSLVDLASIDILRVRERGVPRYNEFRRLLHLKAYDTFEEMADTPEHAADLRRIYSDPEEVDTMIGMYAEQKPKGFGFSDTAFRIFILMASRRLESDRFFTRDYRPEVYTKEGIDWVEYNSMRTLLLRHFPELEPALQGVKNPFAPWQRSDRVTELAPGIHSLGHGKGGHVHAFLIDNGRRALARRHPVRERCATRAAGDPRARSRAERPEADRDHARPPLAPRRPRRAEARERRHRLRARWEADIVAGDRRAQPVSILPRQSLRLIPFQLGLWLDRPKHEPVPRRRAARRRRRVRPAAGAARRRPLTGPPRVLLAGTELRDRRRRRRHLARALSRLARLQPEQETAPRDAAAPGRPRSDDRRRRPRRSADPGGAGGAPRARGEAGPLINRRTRSTLSGLLRLV